MDVAARGLLGNGRAEPGRGRNRVRRRRMIMMVAMMMIQ